MSILDLINGAFELLGGVMLLNNCRIAMRDKAVKGVSILSCAFFTSWGAWNLYYYPSLNQWASFLGGLLIFGANAWWVSLLIKYRRNS